MGARELMNSSLVKELREYFDAGAVEAWRNARTPEAREYAYHSDKAMRDFFSHLAMLAESPINVPTH
jgi:hypothetical protein